MEQSTSLVLVWGFVALNALGFVKCSRETTSLSKSINCIVPSSNLLFHALLYFPVALPNLEINVAVSNSLMPFSLKRMLSFFLNT